MHLLWNMGSCFNNLVSSFYRGWQEFPCRYKKQALAVLFLVLEAISTALDLFGKSRSSFLLAAFLLSAFGFAMTIYTFFIERTQLRGQRQLRVVEIVFSCVQLIATFVHFIMAILGAKNNYNVSLFPLAFAIIAAMFVFKKNEFQDGLHNNLWEDQELQDITWENQELGDYDPWNYYHELDDQSQDHQELQDDLWEDYQELQGVTWENQEQGGDPWNYHHELDDQWQDHQELQDDLWEDYQELQGVTWENQELGGDPWNYHHELDDQWQDHQELQDDLWEDYQELQGDPWEDQELYEDSWDYQEPCHYLSEDQELQDNPWDYQELNDNPLEDYDNLWDYQELNNNPLEDYDELHYESWEDP